MDIGRGPRRARHVAANLNVGAAQRRPDTTPSADTAEHAPAAPAPAPSLQVPGQAQPQRPSHRTPDQTQPIPAYQRQGRERRASPAAGAGAGLEVNPFRLHRPHRPTARISMPFETDDSGSEPEDSFLAVAQNARHRQPRVVAYPRHSDLQDDDDDDAVQHLIQAQYEATGGDTSLEGEIEEEPIPEEEEEEEEGMEEEVDEEEDDDGDDEELPVHLVDPAALGLKEISNLGRFTVSSHKPGSGVEELRSDDLKLYWQSDGPQPHKLTVYFVKRVNIRDIRFFVDYSEDESYTPTKIVFKSGTSENNLIEFATMAMDSPVGWQQVPVAGTGGEPDGNTLVSYVLQMQILENHQNGKDTHLRGIKIYAFDGEHGPPDVRTDIYNDDDDDDNEHKLRSDHQHVQQDSMGNIAMSLASAHLEPGDGAGFSIPDFMREPEIR